MYGNVVWRIEDFPILLDFEVLENSDILAEGLEDEIFLFRPPYSMVWTLPAPDLHHCVIQMPNGNIMYLYNYYIDVEGWDFPFQADGIREVDPITRETVWEWRCDDYLSTDDYCPYHMEEEVFDAAVPSYNWSHANSLVYREEESAVYINFRHLDRIVKIDYPSGEVLWSMGRDGDFGAGHFSHGHDPQFLENGNILLYDNGNHRQPVEFSRAVEIAYDPVEGWAQDVWQWPPVDGGFWFYDAAMGDANRLPNGNTLITSSQHGQIYEVTPSGEIAWQLYMDARYPWPEYMPMITYKAEMLMPPLSDGLSGLFGAL